MWISPPCLARLRLGSGSRCDPDVILHCVVLLTVTNYVRHYSAHDHQRHVTRIPEESCAPRSDHKTLYRPSPPPPPIVDLPHMLHASAPLANPQTARTFHCALTLRMRSHALACMPVLPPILRREEPRPCTCPRSRCTFLHP